MDRQQGFATLSKQQYYYITIAKKPAVIISNLLIKTTRPLKINYFLSSYSHLQKDTIEI